MDPFTILNEVNTRLSVIFAIEYETHFFVRAYVRWVVAVCRGTHERYSARIPISVQQADLVGI